MNPKTVEILIVEDHPIVLRGLESILAESFSRATFGKAEDGPTAMKLFNSKNWDIVLLDINIPGRGGMEVLEDMLRISPRTKILVVSTYAEEEFALRSFKLGASGYLCKSRAAEELVAAVNKIIEGGKYVVASLADRLADALCDEGGCRLPHETLSPRENTVLQLIVGGKTIRQIGAELALSEKTVATYRYRLAQKLGLSTNVELTRYAFQHGLTQ